MHKFKAYNTNDNEYENLILFYLPQLKIHIFNNSGTNTPKNKIDTENIVFLNFLMKECVSIIDIIVEIDKTENMEGPSSTKTNNFS